MKTEDQPNITYHVTTLSSTPYHYDIVEEGTMAVFLLLRKLGLKTIPYPVGYTLTMPAAAAGQFVYSGNGNSFTITTTNHVAGQLTCIGGSIATTYSAPRLKRVRFDNPTKAKKSKGFSREEKQQWRKQWKDHSRSPARR